MSKQMPLSIGEVIAKFPAETRERYDFTSAVYTGALERITGIKCKDHGEFSQYASQLRKNGSGCPSCGGEVRATKKRLTQAEAITKAKEKHGGFYTYERTVYRTGHQKMTVTCPVHGDFDTLAINHIYGGRGCPVCGAAKRGHRKNVGEASRKSADTRLQQHSDSFEREAREIHGDRYDYSQVVYGGRKTHVTIGCPTHGAFEQTPLRHLDRKHGCPECSHHRSKGEAEILAFVADLADATSRRRDIIPPKELDIYIPDHGLAIEYCGEYWHGARNVEEEPFARTRHLDKMRACEAKGIHLLTVFENEWLQRPEALKHLIRNALGKTPDRIMARKCDIRRVGPVPAFDFYERFHPQGGGGYGQHYGLYHGAELVACMRFTFGINDRGRDADRVWTLSRYATSKSVAGGASRLLKAFIDEVDPPLIKSFSDNRYFTGKMYEGLGFAMEEESPPEYQVYHIKTGLLPKASWQRRKIAARIRDVGSTETYNHETDHRTEREMTYLLGARRVYDCGKKRWVWRKPE